MIAIASWSFGLKLSRIGVGGGGGLIFQWRQLPAESPLLVGHGSATYTMRRRRSVRCQAGKKVNDNNGVGCHVRKRESYSDFVQELASILDGNVVLEAIDGLCRPKATIGWISVRPRTGVGERGLNTPLLHCARLHGGYVETAAVGRRQWGVQIGHIHSVSEGFSILLVLQ